MLQSYRSCVVSMSVCWATVWKLTLNDNWFISLIQWKTPFCNVSIVFMHKWLYASHDIIIARFVFASFHVSNSALCTTVLSIPIDVVLTFSISYEDFGTWSMQVSKALGLLHHSFLWDVIRYPCLRYMLFYQNPRGCLLLITNKKNINICCNSSL